MRFTIKSIGLVGFLAVILIIALIYRPNSSIHFDVSGSGYFHLWQFAGETPTEWIEGPSRTVDSVAFPLHFQHDEIIRQASEELISRLTSEMKKTLGEKGVEVTILKITPHVDILERQESRQFRDYTEVTMYYTVKAGADVEFQTDQPLEGESELHPQIVIPLAVWLIIAGVCVIGAFYIFSAIADWIRSFCITESKITRKYYDENGNLIREDTEWQRGFDWSGFMWIAVVVGAIGIIGLVVFTSIMGLGMFGRSRACKRFGGDFGL